MSHYTHTNVNSIVWHKIALLCVLLLCALMPAYVGAQEIEQEERESQEVIDDTQVTHEDLETKEARVLPDSPLYGLKNFGRTVREAFTFDPIRKAEIRLEHANEQFAEAQQLLVEKPNSERALEKATQAAERAVNRLEKISDAGEQVKERKEEGDERARELLENVLDKQIKHQKVIEEIERRVEHATSQDVKERTRERLAQAKEDSAKNVGAFVSEVGENSEELAETIDRVLERQKGSEFRDLKNLEVLKRVETFVPDQARDAIQQAQDNAFKRFNNRIEGLPADERGERFERYVENIPGDHTIFFEQFDQLKAAGELDEELVVKLEKAKDIAARRFKEQVEGFENDFEDQATRERMRERALSRFTQEQPDVAQLRAVKEMRERVHFDSQEIEQDMRAAEEESVRKFAQTFTDETSQDQARRFRELSEKMAANPDPVTFRLLQTLEQEVMSDPQKKAFIEQMEAATRAQFATRASEEGDRFLERIATANPDDIEIFEQLRREFEERPDEFFGEPEGLDFGPPPFGDEFERDARDFVPPPNLNRFFDRAQQKQAERITRHIQDIDDPKQFEDIQKRFSEVDPRVLEEIRKQQSQFDEVFNQQRQRIQEQEFQQQEQELRRDLESQREAFEKDFNQRMNAASEEERDALIRQRAQEERELRNREFEERQRMFEHRINIDPFCDEQCQREERARFERDVAEDRQGLADEDEFRSIENELREFLDERQLEQREQEFERQAEFERERDRSEDEFAQPFEDNRHQQPQFDDRRIDDSRPTFIDENRGQDGDFKEEHFEDRPQQERFQERFDERSLPPEPPEQQFRQQEERRNEQSRTLPPRPSEVFDRLQQRQEEVLREELFKEVPRPESDRGREIRIDARISENDEANRQIERGQPPQPRPEIPVQLRPAPADLQKRDIPPQSAVQRYLSQLFGNLVIKAALAGW